MLLLAGLLLAGCAAAGPAAPSQDPVAQPSPSLSTTLGILRHEVMTALGAASYQVQDARTPYRPGESPTVAAAPRAVLQALIPSAPDAGFVVLYEFSDPGSAAAAAQELTAYIASGIGRVQFPVDARFTVRQIGAGLVFYVWTPGSSADPDAEQGIETALGTLGQGYPVGG
jgi:hypothetical protein